ncbi:MAG: hypothetical protein HQL77_00280 [Magnetococcales bacterium]|nr:hypothetical protein [Magnetococcales bacterium]MBF0420015.1 hypothetical protein [Magnetococcales bacterium]MBF0433788.1 hypothetical protein [Magnetococcales bacterium]
MISDRLLLTFVVGCGLLSGCSSTIALPWEKDNLDPSRVATREPLEIPPDLSELPNPDAKNVKQDSERAADAWVNPDAVGKKGGGKPGGNAAREGGDPKLPFSIPKVHQDNEGLSRNEKENLPGWMEAPVKVR